MFSTTLLRNFNSTLLTVRNADGKSLDRFTTTSAWLTTRSIVSTFQIFWYAKVCCYCCCSGVYGSRNIAHLNQCCSSLGTVRVQRKQNFLYSSWKKRWPTFVRLESSVVMSGMNKNLPFCAQHRSEKEFSMEISCFSAQINNSLPQNVFFAPKNFFDVIKKQKQRKRGKCDTTKQRHRALCILYWEIYGLYYTFLRLCIFENVLTPPKHCPSSRSNEVKTQKFFFWIVPNGKFGAFPSRSLPIITQFPSNRCWSLGLISRSTKFNYC